MTTPTPLSDLADKLPAGSFALQLSNFSFVTFEQKNRPPSRKLRFSLVLQVEHPLYGAIAAGWDGCLAHRGKNPETGVEEVVWGPPATRFGYRYMKTSWTNAALYNLVLEALCKTEYVEALGTNQESTAKAPHEVNINLPLLINAL